MLTQEQKQQILDKIKACFDKADAHYKRTLKRPTQVLFDLNGGAAGRAYPNTHVLRFNPHLALRDWNDMVNDTVPHECAHLIDYEINNKLEEQMLARAAALEARMFGRRRKMPKRDIHGDSWKAVMRVLGVVPKRCHNIDTTGIVRRKSRHDYKCACGATLVVGAKHHNAILRGRLITHRGCGRTLTAAMHVGKRAQAQPAPTAQVPVPHTPAAPRVGSKLDQAIQIVSTHGNASREYLIALLMRELTMSKAGASTYYYAAKKRI